MAGPVFAENNTNKADVYEQLDLFGDIFDRIRSEYVEEVDAKELIEAAINGMLTSLDPHSATFHLSMQKKCESKLAEIWLPWN